MADHGKIDPPSKSPFHRGGLREYLLGLKFDPKALTIIILSTLALMVDAYFNITSLKILDRTLLYLVMPLAVILLGFRQSPARYGFQPGDWQAGLCLTAMAVVILAPLIWLAVWASPELQRYYQASALTWQWLLFALLELFGWEFFFRGFMYFGYEETFGDHALWLQSVPFALAHLNKPGAETLTTLFGGFLFALVARRTRSFWYPFIIHLFVTIFTKWAATSWL